MQFATLTYFKTNLRKQLRRTYSAHLTMITTESLPMASSSPGSRRPLILDALQDLPRDEQACDSIRGSCARCYRALKRHSNSSSSG
uniref:Uncharacterized protein n=1 Tax=Ditylenchus dipsaci TaxID=166011 RepID=A0A915D628_9BILA